MRVSETDGSPTDTSDAVFSIVPVPAITVTSPNGGESWEVGSAHNITWTSVGTVGNVMIEYSTNNGSTWTTIVASTANDGTHPWTVPDTPSTTCRVRVSETDGSPTRYERRRLFHRAGAGDHGDEPERRGELAGGFEPTISPGRASGAVGNVHDRVFDQQRLDLDDDRGLDGQ